MFDREKIETILSRRFPGAASHQMAAAANAIMGLGDEWEEILDPNQDMGHYDSADCRHIRSLVREFHRGAGFRLFRRRET